MATRGPLVRASARRGGILIALGSIQFVVGMALAQWRYPGYSDVANAVSDLGDPAQTSGAAIFDGSIVVLGVVAILGLVMLRSAFAPRRSSRLGLAALVVASLGAIGVGIFPESATELGGRIHALVSLVTFVGAGVGLLALGVAMVRDTRWDGFRGYTALSGVVTLAALVAYVGGASGSSVAGLVERVIIAPVLLWGVVAGLHLARLPVYAPEARATF